MNVGDKLRRIGALNVHSFRLVKRDVPAFVILIFMPLLIVGFMGEAYKSALEAEGHTSVSGAEQSVPALSVMFSFLVMPQVGYFMLREFDWRTWDRLRLAGLSMLEVMAGKAIVPLLLLLAQFIVVFGYGAIFGGFDILPALPFLAPIGFLFGVSVVFFAFLLVAISRSIVEFGALANLAAILMSGLSGVFATSGSLPDWIHFSGRLLPGYWAMEAYRDILLGAFTLEEWIQTMFVLFVFAVLFGVTAVSVTARRQARGAWS